MATINRIPDGLQSLLGVKALGRNPQEIEGSVRPSIDLTEFYYANKTVELEVGQEIAAIAANGLYATVEIPAGEVWYVYSVAMRCSAISGSYNGSLQPVLQIPGPALSTIHPLNDGREFTGVITSPNEDIRYREIGSVLPPGTIFGSYANTVATANTLNIRTTVLCVKLDI